jgi:hypothetical protein
MKMEAAAHRSSQLLQSKLFTTKDAYFFGSLIFPVFYRCRAVNRSNSEGDLKVSKAFKLLAYGSSVSRDTIGALKFKYYHLQRGVCGNTSMCDGPMQVFPAVRHSGAEGGEAVHRGDQLPQLARPKGWFAAIDQLSIRTTGRLGYISPTTAHTIGYAIISTSTAGLIHCQLQQRRLRAGRSC